MLLGAFGLQVYAIAAILGKGQYVPAMGNYGGVHLAACDRFRLLLEGAAGAHTSCDGPSNRGRQLQLQFGSFWGMIVKTLFPA